MLTDERIHQIFYPLGTATENQKLIARACARAIEAEVMQAPCPKCEEQRQTINWLSRERGSLQAKVAEQAPFVEVGKAMVEITTTVRGPEEWGAIPELWLQCMKERDEALAKVAELKHDLKQEDQVNDILARGNAELLSQVRTSASFAKTAQRLKVEAQDKDVRQTFEIAALREERQKAENLAVQYRQEADHLRFSVNIPRGDDIEWYCPTCNIIHPKQYKGSVVQPCPDCQKAMLPTSRNLREIDILRKDVASLKERLKAIAKIME